MASGKSERPQLVMAIPLATTIQPIETTHDGDAGVPPFPQEPAPRNGTPWSDAISVVIKDFRRAGDLSLRSGALLQARAFQDGTAFKACNTRRGEIAVPGKVVEAIGRVGALSGTRAPCYRNRRKMSARFRKKWIGADEVRPMSRSRNLTVQDAVERRLAPWSPEYRPTRYFS